MVRGKAEYRRRLAELKEELEEAAARNDLGRASVAREEIEVLTEQLRAAIGHGGRSRRVSSDVERVRVAVTRRLRAAITQIGRHHPVLGEHLESNVRTGYFCAYAPSTPVAWEV